MVLGEKVHFPKGTGLSRFIAFSTEKKKFRLRENIWKGKSERNEGGHGEG